MHRIAIVAVLVTLPVFAYAKRTSDYVPPPYASRVARSFFALAILALPSFATAVGMARGDRKRMGRAVAISCAFLLAGAAVAATDARNDELWDPAFRGGPFVGLSLIAAIAAAARKDDPRRSSKIAVGGILAIPYALAVSGFGTLLTTWAHVHGVPLSW